MKNTKKKNDDKKQNSVRYPETVGSLAVNAAHTVLVSFDLSAPAEQTLLRLSSAADPRVEHFFRFETQENNQYQASIPIDRLAAKFFAQSGLYNMQVIVGDSGVSKSKNIAWDLGVLDITFPGSRQENPSLPLGHIKPEIHYSFRPVEQDGKHAIGMAFSAGVVALLGGFMIAVRSMFNLGRFPSHSPRVSVSAFVFVVLLCAVLGLYLAFWFGYVNMFQTLQLLVPLVLGAWAFGKIALDYLSTLLDLQKEKLE